MKRGRLLILIGLILACGTAAVVFLLLQNMSKAPATAEVKTEKVVVVDQPLAEGEPVEGRLKVEARPVPIPEDAVLTLEETTGKLARLNVAQGNIVRAGDLQTEEELMAKSQLGDLVEVGYVAVAFPITELSSVSYGIQPDDLVDVLVTFVFVDLDIDTQSKEPLCPPICPVAEGGQTSAAGAAQNPRLVAQLTLQKIRVLGVGRWTYLPPTPQPNQQSGGDTAATGAEPPQYVTLMLTPQDALVLKLAREHDASIDLAIRAKDDTQDFATQQVTLEYILTRFGVTLPAKHEYTIEGLAP